MEELVEIQDALDYKGPAPAAPCRSMPSGPHAPNIVGALTDLKHLTERKKTAIGERG